MTKQLQATMAAMMVMSTISVRAQLSTSTTTQKTSPNTTKTTVVTTDRSASKSKKSSSTRRTARRAPVESATSRELRELRELMVNQQAQLDAMRQQLADKDKRIADATADASTANASAVQANQAAQTLAATIQANQTKIDTLSSDLGDLKLANTGLATTLVTTTRDLNEKIESPTTIHYKGMTIMPVGFFALEGVVRTRSINSDINTPFNATPTTVRTKRMFRSSIFPGGRADLVPLSPATPELTGCRATSRATSSLPERLRMRISRTALPFGSGRSGVRRQHSPG